MPTTKNTTNTVANVFTEIDNKISQAENNSIKTFVSETLSTGSVTMMVIKNEVLDIYEDQMFERASKRAKRMTQGL